MPDPLDVETVSSWAENCALLADSKSACWTVRGRDGQICSSSIAPGGIVSKHRPAFLTAPPPAPPLNAKPSFSRGSWELFESLFAHS